MGCRKTGCCGISATCIGKSFAILWAAARGTWWTRTTIGSIFARVRWTSTVPFSKFRESDSLGGCVEMVRSGDGVFLSTASLFGSEGGTISAQLASIFTRREGVLNDRLLALAPVIFDDCAIPDMDVTPTFLDEHRQLRAGKSPVHNFMNSTFEITTEADEATNYQINGYQDFNGANLLYFASYPTIADVCASRTHYVAEQFGLLEFVTRSSPIGRDIFYFGNANLGDWITCAFKLKNSPLVGLAAYRHVSNQNWSLHRQAIRHPGATLIGSGHPDPSQRAGQPVKRQNRSTAEACQMAASGQLATAPPPTVRTALSG